MRWHLQKGVSERCRLRLVDHGLLVEMQEARDDEQKTLVLTCFVLLLESHAAGAVDNLPATNDTNWNAVVQLCLPFVWMAMVGLECRPLSCEIRSGYSTSQILQTEPLFTMLGLFSVFSLPATNSKA